MLRTDGDLNCISVKALANTRAMDHRQIIEQFSETSAILVSDFDGTLAHPDFYQLVRKRLVPEGTPDYWEDYRSGVSTHFDALRMYFEAAEGGERALLELLDAISLPDNLPGLVHQLRDAGWAVLIVPAGCQWYIDRLLERAGVALPVITNPGVIEDGRLVMRRPDSSPFRCEENGLSKQSVVEQLCQEGKMLAYCGDGFTDVPGARLVDQSRRFARADLAEALTEQQLAFHPFSGWDDVVHSLV
jgi:2-hydroxy-3-keto-5-methylthiopentenyl-1-phosphate phosphatase